MIEHPGRRDADILTVQLQGSEREPERLLLIERPGSGSTGGPVSMVRVSEWSSGAWSAPPQVREVDRLALLAEIEQVFAARRRVGQEMYRVRRWLIGEST